MLGNFSWFFAVCWYFSKLIFSQNSIRNTIRVSNGLDPDQDRHTVSPDLGPNCLQKLSVTSKKRINGRIIKLFACLVIFPDSLSSADIFQNYFFHKILSGTLSECQMVWIQIWTNILSVLIWVQTVWKGYQQMTSHSLQERFNGRTLHTRKLFMIFLSSANFFKINLFTKFFQERYQSVKQFGSRSDPKSCLAWSEYILFGSLSANDTSM